MASKAPSRPLGSSACSISLLRGLWRPARSGRCGDGYAYGATLREGETFTTIELKINFLRAVRKATLTAEARVVKAGSTLGYVECDVKDQTGRLVARASSTCMKLNAESKSALRDSRGP